ncbi:hypothetical protein [Maritimibacter alkaliphilus]|uniref:hypothetical protein n=1 Tax=Maritimibacter alkaliphilus TaxID=404236 RepID=UPI001C96FC43|nr:hypothetical protein [Maritimibacter alkaliphilus]MBY6088951.1 hypothetical protein [Maritimibacter alkaliphilus]
MFDLPPRPRLRRFALNRIVGTFSTLANARKVRDQTFHFTGSGAVVTLFGAPSLS